jgi:SAM-dependent methyltransferase
MSEPSPFDDGELYDILFTGFTYGIDFYTDLARQARGPVLDVCCGTGRILLPCLQAGADGDGLDLFPPMLATLRQKSAALGFSPGLHVADMADFQLPRRYALVMITFNAFVHNLTQESQIRCLQCCREHLLPGGLLAFDTCFPALGIIGAAENTRELELETTHPQTGQKLRLYDTRSFNRVEQIQTSINEIEFRDGYGNLQSVRRCEFQTRWIYKHEMALLLRVAGYARWEICGDFDRRPLTNETDAMIVLAWPE